MNILRKSINKVCLAADVLARTCFFAVMILVLLNIVMRKLFQPISGAYELVGPLTAVGIALALAQCALQDGHIAVSLFTDRLPLLMQQIFNIIVFTISLGFWLMISFSMFDFASTTLKRGVVTANAQLPIYPFILIIAVGLVCLSLALVSLLLRSFEVMLAEYKLKGQITAGESAINETSSIIKV